MSTILLAGDLQEYRNVVGALICSRIQCHSLDSLRYEQHAQEADAVIIGMPRLAVAKPLLNNSKMKWIFLTREEPEIIANGEILVLHGRPENAWSSRLQRFIEQGLSGERNHPRQPFSGGVRLKDSAYGTASGRRAQGKLVNLSSQGAGIVCDVDPGFKNGEFAELAFRDAAGVLLVYETQVRWKKTAGGMVYLGLKLVAASRSALESR